MNIGVRENVRKERNLLSLILGFGSLHHLGELFFFLEIKAITQNSVNVDEFGKVSGKKCKRL